MNRRTLGRTGLELPELGLGGLFLASRFADATRSTATVKRAIELGIRYVDTAPGYGNSEEALGQALKTLGPAASSLILSTKLGGRPVPFEPQNKGALMASLEESLRLLGRDRIDILMIHEPDRPGQYDWWADWDGFTGPVLDVLDELKRSGLIRFTGLGGTTAYTLPHIIATGRFDVVLTAFNYSLLWREAEMAVLPAAQAQGMGIIVGSPLQQGALARRYDHEVNAGAPWLSPPRRRQYQALYAFLDEIGMSIVEASLRFVLSNPAVSCTLTGPRSPQEVEENVAAVEKGPLPPDILARLAQIAAMVPFRPFEEPFVLPFERPYQGPGNAR